MGLSLRASGASAAIERVWLPDTVDCFGCTQPRNDGAFVMLSASETSHDSCNMRFFTLRVQNDKSSRLYPCFSFAKCGRMRAKRKRDVVRSETRFGSGWSGDLCGHYGVLPHL